MSRSGKLTARETAMCIMREGEVISRLNDTLVVFAYGHKYKIENAFGRVPKITLLREENNEH